MNEPNAMSPVASPCIDICTLDDRDVCIGCGRTLEEITGWTSSDDQARRAIVERAAQRKVKRPFTDR